MQIDRLRKHEAIASVDFAAELSLYPCEGLVEVGEATFDEPLVEMGLSRLRDEQASLQKTAAVDALFLKNNVHIAGHAVEAAADKCPRLDETGARFRIDDFSGVDEAVHATATSAHDVDGFFLRAVFAVFTGKDEVRRYGLVAMQNALVSEFKQIGFERGGHGDSRRGFEINASFFDAIEFHLAPVQRLRRKGVYNEERKYDAKDRI